MLILTNKQTFIFVLFVFQLLKHINEPTTLMGGTVPLLWVETRLPVPFTDYGHDAFPQSVVKYKEFKV